MTPTVVNFLRAAIIYLVIGITLGVLLVIYPQWRGPLSTSHAHINLLGWVSMMISGVAYHVLPRFRGRQLYSETLATAHFWLMNIGLIGLAVFLALLNLYGGDLFKILAAISGAIEAISLYLFAYNMLRTL
jgi:cytochrome c oxidase cbb3-type subunit 1